jgi:hypothetical protein
MCVMSEDKDPSSGVERSPQQYQQQPPQGRSGEGVASMMARLQSDSESASTPEQRGNPSSRD